MLAVPASREWTGGQPAAASLGSTGATAMPSMWRLSHGGISFPTGRLTGNVLQEKKVSRNLTESTSKVKGKMEGDDDTLWRALERPPRGPGCLLPTDKPPPLGLESCVIVDRDRTGSGAYPRLVYSPTSSLTG